VRTRFFAAALAVGLTLGVQPQGCQDSGKIAESFRYLAQDDDFHPPAQGEVTFYQTHGPVGGGSVQALAEGPDGLVYAGTFGDGVYVKATAEDRWRPAEDGPPSCPTERSWRAPFAAGFFGAATVAGGGPPVTRA
jgi:hypothetical protein